MATAERWGSLCENGPHGWLVGARATPSRGEPLGFIFGYKRIVRYLNGKYLSKMEQPLPSLLFVVKSHKRFIRYKGSGAVPYQRSPSEKATRSLHTVA
jgi:hypothetical protein